MADGTIKRIVLDRGFGFLEGEDGKEYFFHMSGLAEGLQIESLREGQKVSYDTERSPRGPRATRVAVAE